MSELKTKMEYIDDTKELIKAALQAKGQAVTDNDTFRSYAEKITNMTDIVAEEITVTPSTIQQILEPTGQYNSFSKVTVSPVTANIDSNIKAENIRAGVTILRSNRYHDRRRRFKYRINFFRKSSNYINKCIRK